MQLHQNVQAVLTSPTGVAQSFSASQAVVVHKIASRSLSSALSFSETASRGKVNVLSLSQSISLSQNNPEVESKRFSILGSLTLSQTARFIHTNKTSASQILSLSETVSKKKIASRTVSQSISLSENAHGLGVNTTSASSKLVIVQTPFYVATRKKSVGQNLTFNEFVSAISGNIVGLRQLNRDDPLTLINTSAPGTYQNPHVVGVSVRVSMKDIEATRNVFNWSIFDQELVQCTNNNKRAFLRIPVVGSGHYDPPTWLAPLGVQMFNYTTATGTAPVPIPWDTTWLTEFGNLISAFAGKYKDHPKVDVIMMTGADITGGEMHLIGSSDATIDQNKWITAGYTSAKLIGAWQKIIDIFNINFPNKCLGLNVSTPVFSTDGVVEAVEDYAISKIGPRLIVQHNALAAKTVLASTPHKWVTRAYQKGAKTAFQQLCAMTTNAARWGGSGTGTDADFDLGLSNCQATTGGTSLFLETYPPDVRTALYPYYVKWVHNPV